MSAEAYKQLLVSNSVIYKHSSNCQSSCQLRPHANIEGACITSKTSSLTSTALLLSVTLGALSPAKDGYKIPAPFRHTLGSFSVLGHSVFLQIVVLWVVFPFGVKLKAFVLLVLAFLIVVHVDGLTGFIRDLLGSPHAESDMRSIVRVTSMFYLGVPCSTLGITIRHNLGVPVYYEVHREHTRLFRIWEITLFQLRAP